ncbi:MULTISPECIES: hypothetical protein [Cyanophyceae]|uniref:hypothetical protein n=1 Tax=Cyanophyceae TaxID=3028117 RepID=UPI0016866717|nr:MULTISPECIES: hypothetical protein [Cyanophyceae]MBD1915000.1 hypothetical protein [Phormidium sp. FACHB-77]MBD2032787.1 hypothetical protein [Phormidium sp. FACHB-322]MBD2049932.1 hypothetical protein [Leptolyngbya sp. FACHB-60]
MRGFLAHQDALDALLEPFPESWRDTYPQEWPQQQFDQDDQVCWKARASDGREVIDHGGVRGYGIRPVKHSGQWRWNYLVELDEASPSLERMRYALLWQDDILGPWSVPACVEKRNCLP